MNRDELIEKLKGYEWRDLEFKEAKWAVPRDVYTTVSAFSNTDGGHLIFGIKKKENQFEIIGVIDVDKVQNEFLNTLRSGNKISAFIAVQESRVDDEKGTVLIFFIPEASRKDKPVHLNGNWRKSYIRRGGSDQHCTDEEIRRFMRDADDKPYDSEAVEDIPADGCFDDEVVNWYRKEFNRREPGRHESLNNLDFLNEWGFVVENQGRLLPIRAGILCFGKGKYVRQIIPRPIVDYQRIDFESEDWTPEQRWSDRVTVEENLIRAWWQLVERYMKLAERPFSLDVATMRRDDQPPDYISFREATINLLMHQDYGDNTRMAYIQLFRDKSVFWNPGDAFYTQDQLLDSGAKNVRNPSIVSAFRRIGLSDQAGTGIRAIFRSWHRLGHVPPDIHNDKAEKTFELLLSMEPLISEKQRIVQTTMGVPLSETEADVFAYACKKDNITVTDVRALTGGTPAEARAILDRLVLQVLLKPIDPEAEIYTIMDHLKEKAVDLTTGQVEVKIPDLSTGQPKTLQKLHDKQWIILNLCDVPRTLKELMDSTGMGSRGYFVTQYLKPLLGAKLIQMTNPENPRAANQRYGLTKMGVELNAWRLEHPREQEKPIGDG
jgi:ATP-dependent DNA helicase RecG